MHRAFEEEAPRPDGWWRRLFGWKNKANAIVDLKNLLAGASRITEVSLDQVEAIGQRYSVDLDRRFGEELAGLYRRYLRACLADQRLSEEEEAEVESRLRQLGYMG